jgi:lipopolysaccharide export system protein LptC
MSDRDDDTDGGTRSGLDLVAPRRIFKRKKRGGLLLALKIGLPLVAVTCVAYIVVWSRIQLPNITINPVQATSNAAKPSTDVTVNQVKYDGVDARNRPFTITAETASQPDKSAGAPAATTQNQQQTQPVAVRQDGVINLTNPEADMTMQDGAWVDVKADSGIYNRDQGTVDLSGNVKLFHDTGLQFETDAATVDLKNNTAQGDQPVEGQNADGTLAAEGFQVLNDGRMVIFTGRSYMKIYPKSKGSSE